MSRRLVIGITAILGVAGLLVLAAYLYDRTRADRIAEGVRAGGVSIGGLTAADARAKLERELVQPLREPVVVRAQHRTFRLGGRAAGVSADLDATVAEALRRTREGSFLTRSWGSFTGDELDLNLRPRLRYSRHAVARLARRVKHEIDRPARDARVQPTSRGRLRRVGGRAGLRVRAGVLRRKVARTLLRARSSRSVLAPIRAVAPRVTVEELPERYPNYILIDRDRFKLKYYRHLRLARTYTVAIGQQGYETSRGLYEIQSKQVNPIWNVPNADWAGDFAGRVIPPGPDNPLKARWMGFNGGAGIHGTNDTWSLGNRASHGCVRMAISDVKRLYAKVDVGTPVYIL
jgi:hypothetical protein